MSADPRLQAGVAGSVPATATPGDEDDPLLELFRSRAEIKKELTRLRAERDHLIDKLKFYHKANGQLETRLATLGRLLGDPERARHVVVYYQLRSLWEACHRQLKSFCEELKSQQVDRERKRQIMEFNQLKQRRLHDVKDRIEEARIRAAEQEEVVAGLEGSIEQMGGLLQFQRRRGARDDLARQRALRDECRHELEALIDESMKLESESWPEFGGISVEGRRAINITVIAYAELLCERFSAHGLNVMARIARRQPPEEVTYGTRADCDRLTELIIEATGSAGETDDISGQLRDTTARMRAGVDYDHDDETIPSRIGDMEKRFIALADGYWDIDEVLI